MPILLLVAVVLMSLPVVSGSDSINGGAGADTISFLVETTAGDVITGGADNDIFQVNN